MRVRRLSLLGAALLVLGPVVPSARASWSAQQPAFEAAPPPAALAVRGRVVDSTGAPVAGARVTVQQPGDPSHTASSVTDSRGEFVVAVVPGPHTIRVA